MFCCCCANKNNLKERRDRFCAGADYYTINPKGNVPALVLDDGTLLNENVAVLQAVADLKPESGVAPKAGTSGRYVLDNTLAYLVRARARCSL